MTNDQIQKYYQKIDNLVDAENNYIVIPVEEGEKLTDKDIDEIKQRRLNSNEQYEFDLIIYRGRNSRYGFPRKPILPNGYINFKNNEYRRPFDKHNPNWTYFYHWERMVNPLKSSPGFIIIDEDIPVYDRNDDSQKGFLKANSVLRIFNIYDNKASLDNGGVLRNYYVKVNDISSLVILNELMEEIKYKIIDNKVYRYIKGIEIEINASIYRLDDETQYVRVDNRYHNNEFYFWEFWGDYFFDNDGNFIKYGYGPLYGK
jgi:hypothetical protein